MSTAPTVEITVKVPVPFWDWLESKRPQGADFEEFAGKLFVEAVDAQRARSKS